jgi:hypothetical protein
MRGCVVGQRVEDRVLFHLGCEACCFSLYLPPHGRVAQWIRALVFGTTPHLSPHVSHCLISCIIPLLLLVSPTALFPVVSACLMC